MTATPAGRFITPATSQTPGSRMKPSMIINKPYSPTDSVKAIHHSQPLFEPPALVTAANDMSSSTDLYGDQGQVDQYYVFPKPPRAQRLCRPSEKLLASLKHPVKQHYPLCTSPRVEVKHSRTVPVSEEPEMKQ